MYNKEQTIHYCTILSDEQWDFVLEGRFSVQRQRCLHRLMTHAVRTRTVCNIKGIEMTLEVGEVAASDVELAEYLGCNRKTVGKLIDSFNRLGLLTGWYVGGVLLTNPHYVKPSVTTKGQRDGKRTPPCNDTVSDERQCAASDGCQIQEQETDSMESETATLSFPLCSSEISDHSADGQDSNGNIEHFQIIDKKNAIANGSRAESHREAQDGTIDGMDDTDTGTVS